MLSEIGKLGYNFSRRQTNDMLVINSTKLIFETITPS